MSIKHWKLYCISREMAGIEGGKCKPKRERERVLKKPTSFGWDLRDSVQTLVSYTGFYYSFLSEVFTVALALDLHSTRCYEFSIWKEKIVRKMREGKGQRNRRIVAGLESRSSKSVHNPSTRSRGNLGPRQQAELACCEIALSDMVPHISPATLST